jgi:DNA-binding transcriptional LysR family regulator
VTISLTGLRAIDSLATEGSMAGAARALGYTPSAISQQIARLERDLRQVLVEQHGRVATLSAAGRLVADVASKILAEIDDMREQLETERSTVAGALSLAAFATATRGIVPSALHKLRDQWPRLETSLVEADSHRALALVEDGTVDIAVAHDWLAVPLVLSEGLSARRLGDDISDALVHEGHELAGRTSVRMDELSRESWLYEPGSVAHDLLIQSFSRTPNPDRFGHRVVEYASQVAMVGAGLGVALVPRMGRGPVPDSVRVLTIEPTPVRQVYAVWRSATAGRPALRAAVRALEDAFDDSVSQVVLRPGTGAERPGPAGEVSILSPGRTG